MARWNKGSRATVSQQELTEPDSAKTPGKKPPRYGRLIMILLLGILSTICLIGGYWLLWLGEMNSGYDALESGNLLDAREYFESAVRRTQMLPGDPRKASTIRVLSKLYYARRSWAKGEALALEAMEIDKQTGGPQGHEYTRALVDMAMGKRKQLKFDEAEALYRQAISIMDGKKEESLELAMALNGLSWIMIKEKKYDEARTLLQRSLDVTTRVFGATHFHLILPLVQMAYLEKELGHTHQAKEWQMKAYKLATEPKDVTNSFGDTVVGMNLLAQMYWADKDYERAEKMFNLAAQNCKASAFGHQWNLFMTDIYSAHAKMLNEQGQSARATELLAKSKEVKSLPEL